MTVSTRYNLYKAGKITKEQFLYEVRKDQSVPFITPLTSFNDAVTMLKQRRIVVENFEAPIAEQSLEDPYMQGFMAGERGEDYQDCPYAQDEDPEAYEMWCDGHSDASAGDNSHVEDSTLDNFYDQANDYEDNIANSEMSRHDSEQYMEEAPSLKEQVKDFVQKAMEGGSSMDEAKEQAKEYFSTEKAALNEASKPKLNIDQVNPYELKKGTEYEMGYADKAAPSWAEASLMNIAGDFAKAQAKALKNLNKDPMYYTRLEANGGKKEKKEKVVKTVWDGYQLGKMAEDDKANVGTKKEGPVKTKGVRVMPDKGVTGTEKVMKEGIKTSVQKIREFVSAQLKGEGITAKTTDAAHNQDILNQINKVPNPVAKKELGDAFKAGKTIDL